MRGPALVVAWEDGVELGDAFSIGLLSVFFFPV